MVAKLLAQTPAGKKSNLHPAVSSACSEESVYANCKIFPWSNKCVRIKYLNYLDSKKNKARKQLLNTVCLVTDESLLKKTSLSSKGQCQI